MITPGPVGAESNGTSGSGAIASGSSRGAALEFRAETVAGRDLGTGGGCTSGTSALTVANMVLTGGAGSSVVAKRRVTIAAPITRA
jgi:hypothetical protein